MLTAHRCEIKTHDDYMNYMYSNERLGSKMAAFKGLTIPSIKAQSYKNYAWYIFYSEHLPEACMTSLKDAIKHVPNTQLVRVENLSKVDAAAKHILPTHSYISVKIDDDDAFHPSYFKLLATYYSPGLVLTPTTGYMVSNYNFSTKKGIASHFSYKPKECAASGLAYADNNVLSLGSHTRVHKKHKYIHYFPQKNLFIRLIHDSNLSDPKHRGSPFPFSFSSFLRSHGATRKTTQRGQSEYGEGFSKSTYIEPHCKDTAVLLAFYNPAGFKRILNNILYIIKILKEKNIPVFVAECVFNNAAPQIPDANLIVNSNSYMFYKEQLLNKLEPLVPHTYTKLVMLDGDIMFDSSDWIDRVSGSLETNDIIQPYDKACWLMPGNKTIRSWKYCYAYALIKKIKIDHTNLHIYHPGFAWAFRRKTFQDLGGFYPNAIIGNGDMLFTFNFFRDSIPEFWIKETLKTSVTIEGWPAYHENFKRVAPKVGLVEARALHLFHGLTSNRQYRTRYTKFAHLLNKKWDEHIKLNRDGLTEFRDPALRPILLSYFKERNEDIPLDLATRESMSKTKKTATTIPAATVNLNQDPPALLP